MFINKVKKGWKELASEVINTDRCVYCGACGAFCANIKFDVDKEIPFEDSSCEEANTCRDGFGLCYNLCPKTEMESFPIRLLDQWVFEKTQDKILGHYIDILSIKLTDEAKKIITNQAGPLTALLHTAMKLRIIDSAIITDKDDNFRPIPFIAETPKDLLNGVGYKPSQGPTLSLIGEAVNRNHNDIAIVGTPCQIQALRKLQNHPSFDFEAYDLVSLAIGTFCTGTYHNQILNEIYKEHGIYIEDIVKVNTDKENFNLQVKTNKNTTKIPLNYLYDKAIRKACFSCSDYTASFADISIGEFGSAKGWNTAIIRSEKGKKVFDYALKEGVLEVRPLEKDKEDLILELTRNKTHIVKI
ncbi:MAG: Coenzyme F420 hydrogenase/dehydrogenase, beta subunit C-terminal domain, partial [Candidatus Thorarchaeota archaeon]